MKDKTEVLTFVRSPRLKNHPVEIPPYPSSRRHPRASHIQHLYEALMRASHQNPLGKLSLHLFNLNSIVPKCLSKQFNKTLEAYVGGNRANLRKKNLKGGKKNVLI